MKIAYLILAHNNPNHFSRLINALSSPASVCFVHIDKKSNIKDFSDVESDTVIFLEKRVKVFRGHFSHVEAELMMIEKALNHPDRFDRFILLSGTDYPLHSVSYIEQFFKKNTDYEFMNITKMPNILVGKPLSRLYGYNPTPTKPRYYLEILVRALLKRLRLIPKIRDYQKYLGDLIPYAGCEWWALTQDACEYIINFVSDKQKLLNFYKHTRVPQEMFFQTVLGNSPFINLFKRNLTYTDWSAGGGHPATINQGHLTIFEAKQIRLDDAFGAGVMLFARKFSDDTLDIIDNLDKIIKQRDG